MDVKLRALRQEVLEANLELVRQGLVFYTFGNASGVLRDEGLVVIKPSGVPYESLQAEDLVVTDLEGNLVEWNLRPSSDLPTHLELYRFFPRDRGYSPHPLPLCDCLGPGPASHSLSGHDTCRYLLRPGPGHPPHAA